MTSLEAVGPSITVRVSGAEATNDGFTVQTLDGDNVLIGGEAVSNGLTAGAEWLAVHARSEGGRTVIEHAGNSATLPAADLAELAPSDATS